MTQSRSWLRRYTAWMALCAICFGVAAPAVSKWLAATQGTIWVQVCSASAPERIALSVHGGPSHQLPAATGDDCPYCALAHHFPFVPPAAASFAPRISSLHAVYADGAARAPGARPASRAHLPRAPPSLC